jgi:hypothetical protein
LCAPSFLFFYSNGKIFKKYFSEFHFSILIRKQKLKVFLPTKKKKMKNQSHLTSNIPKSFYSSVDFTNFVRSGGVEVTPTTLCCSPWSKSLQYGGNVAALLFSGLNAQISQNNPHHHHHHKAGGGGGSQETETAPPSPPVKAFRLCQFSLYFFKPIPLQPLILAPAPPLRVGKKVMHLQASLIGSRSCGDAEGVEVARAVGVFMRQQDMSGHGVTENPRKRTPDHFKDLIPIFGEGTDSGVPRIGGSAIPHFEKPGVGFFWGADGRAPKSMFECKPGDTLEYWMRQRASIFENEPKIDPMHRLLLLGEGSGGLTAFLPLKRFSFVNPMFSMTVLREPRSEWVSVKGRTDIDPATGSGLVSTTMFDEQGICASITQPQIIESWEHIKKKPVLH